MRRGAPAFLPAGSALATWLSAGPRVPGSPRLALWIYRWNGYWFERNWRRQAALYPARDAAGEAGRNLVFVLGFWRSGTTLLHELLAAGPGMVAPRTWQCMNPSGFLIAGEPRSGVAVPRPMDAMTVSALSPQEDEFVLLARGAPSVYRAWLDPRRWRETLPALEQETWLSLPPDRWLDDWRRFLNWCLPEQARTLVIKSPNHVFRLQALHRTWPKARLAWTLRDPVATWHSNRKMWRAMTARYGLWSWRDGDLDRLLFQAMRAYATALRWTAATLDAQSSVYVDFERLGSAPAEVLRALTARLGLGEWESWIPAVRSRLDQAARHAPEAYDGRQSLPPEAAALIQEVRELHRRLAT